MTMNDINGPVREGYESVLDEVNQHIATTTTAGGHQGHLAHVFAGMVRSFLTGLEHRGTGFQDTDAFVLMELLAVARQSIEPRPNRTLVLDAAAAATLRGCYYPQPVAGGGRDGGTLFAVMAQRAGGALDKMDAVEMPDDWTVAEVRTFQAFMREVGRETIEKYIADKKRQELAAVTAVQAALQSPPNPPDAKSEYKPKDKE